MAGTLPVIVDGSGHGNVNGGNLSAGHDSVVAVVVDGNSGSGSQGVLLFYCLSDPVARGFVHDLPPPPQLAGTLHDPQHPNHGAFTLRNFQLTLHHLPESGTYQGL